MAIDDPDLQLPETCPTCGKAVTEWTENDGQGVISGGVTYCSAACAVEDAAEAYKD